MELLEIQLVENQGRSSRTQPSISHAEIKLNNTLHILRSGSKQDCAVSSIRRVPGGR